MRSPYSVPQRLVCMAVIVKNIQAKILLLKQVTVYQILQIIHRFVYSTDKKSEGKALYLGIIITYFCVNMPPASLEDNLNAAFQGGIPYTCPTQ